MRHQHITIEITAGDPYDSVMPTAVITVDGLENRVTGDGHAGSMTFRYADREKRDQLDDLRDDSDALDTLIGGVHSLMMETMHEVDWDEDYE